MMVENERVDRKFGTDSCVLSIFKAELEEIHIVDASNFVGFSLTIIIVQARYSFTAYYFLIIIMWRPATRQITGTNDGV
jgi:hypothetical protein